MLIIKYLFWTKKYNQWKIFIISVSVKFSRRRISTAMFYSVYFFLATKLSYLFAFLLYEFHKLHKKALKYSLSSILSLLDVISTAAWTYNRTQLKRRRKVIKIYLIKVIFLRLYHKDLNIFVEPNSLCVNIFKPRVFRLKYFFYFK